MVRSFRPRQRWSRSPLLSAHRLVPLLLVVMLASSVASQVSLARQMSTGQNDIAEATEEPVDQTPTEVPATEEPLPTEVPVTEEPVDQDMGAVEIDLWECPFEYDLTTANLENLPLDCAAKPGVPINVSDGLGASQQRATGDDGDAHASFVNLAAGQVTVGGPTGIAWCNGIVQHGGPETGYQMIDTSGGAFGWNLQDDEIVFCDWLVLESGQEATAGTTRVVIQTYVCGPDVEFVEPYERTKVLADCPDAHPNIGFTVKQATTGYNRVVSTNGAGVALFPDVPLGEITIAETTSDEFGNPLVYCGLIPAMSADPTPPPVEPTFRKSFKYDLTDATQELSCIVVNAPLIEDYVYGDIVVNHHECPNTLNFASITDAELAAECVTSVNGVVFGLDRGNDFNWVSATGENGSGSVIFDEAYADNQYNLKQLTTPKQLIVICGSVVEGGAVSTPTRMTVAQATIQLVLHKDETITCEWYSIPPDSAPADVEVWVHVCAKWADPAGPFVPFCFDDAPPVSITVSSGGFVVEGTTGDPDALIFRNTRSGLVEIKIPLPSEYVGAQASCETRSREGNTVIVPATTAQVMDNQRILQPVGPDQKLVCNWNLMPPDSTEGDNGKLAIKQYRCDPATLPASPTFDDLAAACTTDSAAHRYRVEGPNDFSKTRTAVNGYAIIENIPPSDVDIDLDLAQGTTGLADPIVFCDSLPADQRSFMSIPMTQLPVRGGDEVTFTIEPKAIAECHWFFTAAAPTYEITLELSAWQCPAGTTFTEPDASYPAKCGVVMAGTDFRLTRTDSVIDGTTGANGTVAFTNQPTGNVQIQEAIPTGHGDPVVLCTVTREGGTPVTSRLSAQGGFLITELPNLGVNYTIHCGWYNLLAGPSSITINLFTCEPGTTLEDDLQTACAPGPNGVVFSLTDTSPNTSDQQSATGDATPNVVQFGSLPIGSYTVTQQLPADTASTFIWDCVGQRMGEQRPTPINTGPSFAIDLHGDENVTCSWFNIPLDEDGRLTVIKYACATPQFVSEVDCEVFEGGQTFDLVAWNGDEWVYASNGTTDGTGRLTFTDLEPGQYWLDEQGGEWCHLASDGLSADGNWIEVPAGAETTVKVYNCGATPGQPGKTPTKYPNTGIPVSLPQTWWSAA